MMIALALLLAAAPAPDLYGLVVGYNNSDDQAVEPLRYADDDAVKNAQLLRELGAELVLLTELDADSARLFSEIDAARPTLRAIERALDELEQRIAASKARGRRTELMIFYSGHGDVKNNEGFIQIAGGRLHRSEFRKLISRTSADAVHVIVDACKSYFLVFDRGPGGTRTKVDLELSTEALPDHVGLLLSTSAAQDSHEWEEFQAGIFSHEVRSALRGAADLDTDGHVSYEETAAFVFGANRAIANARYRPQFFVRAPKNRALVELAGRGGARLVAGSGSGIATHLYVEDARGNRVLDFHPKQDQSLEILIPEERPLFVREVGRSIEYVGEAPGPILLASLEPRQTGVRARGAEHVAFASLFSLPFDRAVLEEYRLSLIIAPPIEVARPIDWPRPALGWASLGFAVAGGVLTGLALNDRGRADETTPHLRRVELNERIDNYNTGSVVLYSLAGTALASYLVWTFWPEDEP
jgi:hypothetical protein